MIAIYKREVRAFFHSFIGWLFLAVSLFMMGLYFTVYNMLMGYPNISYVLQSVIFVFLMIMPVLTMRVLAEERRLKTDQLILTAPVSVGGIVAGKYLALLTVFTVPVLLIGAVPLILSFFGNFQMGISYTALLGFFLYGALGLAVGLFLSSLTESIVIAAVFTFVTLFLGYMMSGICGIISQSGNLLTKVLRSFDMIGRFDMLLNGSLYIPSILYFVSGTLLALFYTVQSIQKRRYHMAGRGWKIGAFGYGQAAVITALTIMVNLLVGRLPENVLSLDVTSNRLFTLTQETKEWIAGLTDDVTVYVLINEDNKDANLDKTLRKIEDLSKHVTVTYVDPAVNPQFYSNYTDMEPATNSLIVTGPERSRVVDYNDIYDYEIDYTYYEYEITGYDGEGQIISAMAYVTTDDMPGIYVLGGHEELVLEGQFVQAVQKQNIEQEELFLLTAEEVPEDAQAVIINAPLNDLSEEETEKMLTYLDNGGSVVIVAPLTETELPNFERILDYFGLSLTDGMIMEADAGMYYQQIPYFLLPEIHSDAITAGVVDTAVFAPYARGILYEDEAEGISYTPLLTTSDDSYHKAKAQPGDIADSYGKEDGDLEGPFTIALTAEKTSESGNVSRAVVVASEPFFTADADSIVPGNNVRFFAGILSTFTTHESSVMIPVKSYDASILAFSTRDVILAGILSTLVIPFGCLVTGFVIWFRRRRK